MEEKVYIVRIGEAALKGQNKSYFEKKLVERLRKLLKKFDGISVTRREGLVFVHTPAEVPQEYVIEQASKVFGISSISPAVEVDSNLEDIYDAAVAYMMDKIEKEGIKTFKIQAKRADKNFPVKSPDLSRMVGAAVLKGCKVLKVDVHEPDVKLYVDLRADKTYLYNEKIPAFGGLPLGTNGKGMVLLSGGIDSPVAAFMMAKRGMAIEAVHFHSYPYTSERAQAKVEELASRIAIYASRFRMHIVNLLPIQEELVKKCPEDEMTIHIRRFMMRIAEKLAVQNDCQVLITGESLGQVASQTSDALVVTDKVVDIPVMRPLIALDKTDIMEIAHKIDTYETSIQPYEDCCTVFLPKHPVTKPKLHKIESSEEALDIEKLVDDALKEVETKVIYPLI